jgi:Zn finger protein HypA/HybF involved in hydrogenase expression
LDEPVFSCPACKSGTLTLLSGRELDIEAIEIEEDAEESATREDD